MLPPRFWDEAIVAGQTGKLEVVRSEAMSALGQKQTYAVQQKQSPYSITLSAVVSTVSLIAIPSAFRPRLVYACHTKIGYRNCERKKATFATRPGSNHWKRRTTERTSPSDALLRAITRNASPRKLP